MDDTPMAHFVMTVVTGRTDDVKLVSMKLQAAAAELKKEDVGIVQRRMDIVLDPQEGADDG